MANTNGTLNAALVAQQGLELLAAQYPVIGQIASDFSNEPVHFNQSVITRIPSVGGVQDYDTTNGYVATTGNFTDVTLTLNKFKHATFELRDSEYSSTSRDLNAEYAKSFAEAIGQDVMTSIAALFTTGNYTNSTTGTLAAASRTSVIVAGNTALNKRKVSKDRFGIFSSDLVGKLWEDSSVASLDNAGVGIRGNELPVIHGVAISEYADLPTTSSLAGVVGAKDSIVFASRVPSDAGFADLPPNGRFTIVTDPKSGLSVQVRESYNVAKGSRLVTFALIYGVAVANPVSLQLVRLT